VHFTCVTSLRVSRLLTLLLLSRDRDDVIRDVKEVEQEKSYVRG
jgi:hypothetical protein